MILFYGLAAYAAVGLAVALAFVAFGVTRLLPHPAPVSLGARVLLIPGTTVLWPYVMLRWINAGRAR
jgi:hypothetical protein